MWNTLYALFRKSDNKTFFTLSEELIRAEALNLDLQGVPYRAMVVHKVPELPKLGAWIEFPNSNKTA